MAYEYQRPAATQTIVQQEPDGRKRTATAVCKDARTGHWELKVEHPSGDKWERSFNGSAAEATLALGVYLNQYRHQFVQDGDRGDRPQRQNYDWNRSVSVQEAPIIPSPRR